MAFESRPTDDTKVYYIVLLLPAASSSFVAYFIFFLVFPFRIEYATLNNEASLPHPVCTSLWRFPGLPLWHIEGCVLYIVPSCASVFRIRLEMIHSIFSFLPTKRKLNCIVLREKKQRCERTKNWLERWSSINANTVPCSASIWSDVNIRAMERKVARYKKRKSYFNRRCCGFYCWQFILMRIAKMLTLCDINNDETRSSRMYVCISFVWTTYNVIYCVPIIS